MQLPGVAGADLMYMDALDVRYCTFCESVSSDYSILIDKST